MHDTATIIIHIFTYERIQNKIVPCEFFLGESMIDCNY